MSDKKVSRRDFIGQGLGLGLGLAISACASHTARRDPASDLDSANQAMSEESKSFLRSIVLAHSIDEMKTEYDAIVVGSGYGASIIAARLAGKFKELCILERGKEWRPGDFPKSPTELAGSVRNHLNPHGLIDANLQHGNDIDIICGNGLGGTSLLNAAIAIRPPQNVLLAPEWPDEIHQAVKDGSMEKYYQRAESMLHPHRFDADKLFKKSEVHHRITEEVGQPYMNLRLNMRPLGYKEGLNEAGYPQGPCIGCGDCCTGCNYGAKNTLATNYLPTAKARGAKIFTEVEVHHISKSASGYELHVNTPKGPRILKARTVFLGAGTKGSTSILLRSQSHSFRFSETLGTRLSTNGDLLALAYNSKYKTNALAFGNNPSLIYKSRNWPGPIISGGGDFRANVPDDEMEYQFLLMDTVFPSSLKRVVAAGLAAVAERSDFPFTPEQRERMKIDLHHPDQEEDGALNHSMFYLACGHDSSGGRYVYDRHMDRVSFVWKDVTHEKTFEHMNSVIKKCADDLGAMFIRNPRETVFGGNRIQTTHPLGGCPMGNDHRTGVVDHLGRVFDGQGGVHENLYVVDGGIIPRSLAATPLLTISAMAERIADHLI